MKSCRSISRVLALGLMGATLTAAFLPAPTAILPARSNPTACRGRAMEMINLPRFSFGRSKAEGTEVDVAQIRGGSTVAVPAPSISMPTATIEPPLEDKGKSVSRFRQPVQPASTDVALNPIAEEPSNIQAASAVIGAVVGLAVGGPVVALFGAALLSFSCTASNEAGDAARGTGKTTLEAYNFVAKVDKKRRFLKKLADAVVNLYNQIKAEIVTDKTALEKTESTLKKGMEVTAELYVKYDVPKKMGFALEKTGELSVKLVKALIKYNEEFKVTERIGNAIKDAAKAK